MQRLSCSALVLCSGARQQGRQPQGMRIRLCSLCICPSFMCIEEGIGEQSQNLHSVLLCKDAIFVSQSLSFPIYTMGMLNPSLELRREALR